MSERGKFVSQEECREIMSDVRKDLVTIKNALVGPDLRGGIVKDIADLNIKIAGVIQTQKETKENKVANKELNIRKLLLYMGIIGTLFGVVVGHILDMVW